ncbi:MAG TPA: hypothetical protein VF622_19800 [Segetibacter sp.]
MSLPLIKPALTIEVAEKFEGAVDKMNHHELTQFRIKITAVVGTITSNGLDFIAGDNTCKGEKFLLPAKVSPIDHRCDAPFKGR